MAQPVGTDRRVQPVVPGRIGTIWVICVRVDTGTGTPRPVRMRHTPSIDTMVQL